MQNAAMQILVLDDRPLFAEALGEFLRVRRPEIEIVAEGSIAVDLRVEEVTVKAHVTRILAKTGLRNRVQLAARLIEIRRVGRKGRPDRALDPIAIARGCGTRRCRIRQQVCGGQHRCGRARAFRGWERDRSGAEMGPALNLQA